MARRKIYKTEGLVLKHMPIGEADRIVTLASPSMGKVRAIARGVRRTRSKMGGHLEPLTHVRVSVAQGRSLDVITEAETIHSFRALRQDLQLVSRAVYLAELVESFSQEQSPNATVFNLLLDALQWLQDTQNAATLMRYFELRLLGHTGFSPELYRCVECRSMLGPGDYSYSCVGGGILCNQCRALSGEVVLPLSLDGTKVLRYLQRAPYPRVAGLRIDRAVLQEVERVLREFIKHVLERELKSTGFMKLVTAEGAR